jgi:hypothetical protein
MPRRPGRSDRGIARREPHGRRRDQCRREMVLAWGRMFEGAPAQAAPCGPTPREAAGGERHRNRPQGRARS